MDLVAGPATFFFIMVLAAWCMSTGLISGLVHKKTGSLAGASLAGLLPLVVVWLAIQGAALWPDKPQVSVVNGKAYTAETLPPPNIGPPQEMPVDDVKNLALLQRFGLEPSAIDLCRRKGCRVDFTTGGGVSSFGPLKKGDWQYVVDPATGKWVLKD